MIIIEGYLKKWTNFISRWQERYFFLENGVLKYRSSKDGPIKGSVALKLGTITVDQNDPLRIVISFERQELILRATSIIDKYRWVKALRDGLEAENGSMSARLHDPALPALPKTRSNTMLERADSNFLPGKGSQLLAIATAPSYMESGTVASGELNQNFKDVLDAQSKIDIILEELAEKAETQSDKSDPSYTLMLKVSDILNDLMKGVTRLVTDVKVEQGRIDNLWTALHAELDKSEGVRINFQNDDGSKCKVIDNTANGVRKPHQEPEIKKDPIKTPLSGIEEECKEIKFPMGNGNTSMVKNANETMYTEAKSFARNKRNVTTGGQENTFTQDQTCFQSFAVDEEKEEELQGAEILSEINNPLNGNKNTIISNILFDELHPRTKAIFVESVAMKDICLTNNTLRNTIPYLQVQESKPNLWSIFRESVMHDITKIEIPLSMNEPLSFLQRVAEMFKEWILLSRANNEHDQCTRIGFIVAFVISSYCDSSYRLKKPFDPVLGETYEYNDKNSGFKLIAEQTDLQTMALFAEHPDFEAAFTLKLKSEYLGRCVEFKLVGSNEITLKTRNEKYTFNHPTTVINNILTNKIWIDHHGTITVKNESNGTIAAVDFIQQRIQGIEASKIEGVIRNSDGSLSGKLTGKWTDHLEIAIESTGHKNKLWELEKERSIINGWTGFSLQLNNLNWDLLRELPPTDSRLRADIRALEKGNVDLALYERRKIEDRIKRKKERYDLKHAKISPLWFKIRAGGGVVNDLIYDFTGKYWEEKMKKEHYDEEEEGPKIL